MLRRSILLLTFALTALSASILPSAASSSFPQCGLTCSALTNAQTSCESGTSDSWASCFCQSSLLTGLKSSGSVCASCSSDDQATLSTWYNNYCKSGGTSASTTSATSATASSTATATGTASKANANSSTTEEKKSWWSTHYQWVIMLIVLLIGFSIIGAVGVWFKRRYDAKRPNLYHGGSTGALSTASPPRDAAWGPTEPVMPGLPSGSVTSSRSTVAKSSTPVPSRSKLSKMERYGDMETRQV
ncbi:unnamed protein product [Penicillium olsonii]|nr:unnamed protein product [Penicillium olsonii]CAG7930844.1 unnamed protein product [Penicillium olsonii]